MRECRNCKQVIPWRVVIDNKERLLTKRVYCLTCSPFGSKNRKQFEKSPKTTTLNCRQCGEDYIYRKNYGTKILCHKCNTKNKRVILKQKLVDSKGGKCQKCGYSRCLQALSFHHRDPSTKKFNISGNGMNQSLKVLLLEVEKCDLLCMNCHAETESKDF